jgi:hypothetical protein
LHSEESTIVNTLQPWKNTLEKITLLLLIVGGITWLGGMLMRGLLADELLVRGTLQFRPDLTPIVERELFRLMNHSSIFTLVGYVVVFLSGIVFLRTTRLRLKQNGWLMMSALLFYLFTPVEAYMSFLDGKMIALELWGEPTGTILRELFIERLGALKGLPFIAILCYCTIIGLAVWQPMTSRA